MADIDDILASGSYGASSKDKDVTVEMLDYDFVDSCQDVQLLRGIIRRLKSGRDGHYEALTKHAESRLLEVLPVKERARVVAMRTGPSPDEVESAEAGLQDWHDTIQATDAEIKLRQGPGRQQVPPPRFVVCDSNGKSGEAPAPAGTRGIAVGSSSGSKPQTSQRISGYDFKAWEKFDPDVAEAELDKEQYEEEQLLSKSRAEREQAQQQLEARRQQRRQAEMESVLRGMDVSALSAVQRRVSSERERQKGNECFRAQESEQAYVHYTRSIALLGDINFNLKLSADDGDGSEQRRLLAMAYCNRAVAGMKLDRLQQAEDDCGSALGLDPQYLKAWMRRGVARHRRGRYRAAVTDFGEAMKLAEAAGDVKLHAQLKALRDKSLASLREVEGEGADVPEVGGVHTKEPIATTTGDSAAVTPGPTPPDRVSDAQSDVERWHVIKPQCSAPPPLTGADVRPWHLQADQQDPGTVVLEPRMDLEVEVEVAQSAQRQTATTTSTERAASCFRRVPILADDDGSEEEGPDAAGAVTGGSSGGGSEGGSGPPTGFRRIAIAEDSSDDDEEGGESPTVAARPISPPSPEAAAPAHASPEERAALRKVLTHSAMEVASATRSASALRGVDESHIAAALTYSDNLKIEGNALMKAGDTRGAIALYSAAVEACHTNAAALSNRAHAHMELGEWEAAAADASAVLSSGAVSGKLVVKALYRRGLSSLRRAQQLATQADPAAPPPLALLSTAHQDLERLLQLEPNNAEGRRALHELRDLTASLSTAAGDSAVAAAAALHAHPPAQPPPPPPPAAAAAAAALTPAATAVTAAAAAAAAAPAAAAAAAPRAAAAAPPTAAATAPSAAAAAAAGPGRHARASSSASGSRSRSPAARRHARAVSFDDGSHPGDAFKEDEEKVAKDRAMEAAHPELARTPWPKEHHAVISFADGSQPGDSVPSDAVKQQADSALERENPDIAKTHWSEDNQLSQTQTPSSAAAAAAAAPLNGASHGAADMLGEADAGQDVPNTHSSQGMMRTHAEKVAAAEREKSLGNALLQEGNPGGALAHYSKGLACCPGHVALLNNRSLARLQMKDYEGCIADASAVLSHETANTKALSRRGKALCDIGRYQEAIQDLQQVLARQPSESVAKEALVKAKAGLKEQAAALPPPQPPAAAAARAQPAAAAAQVQPAAAAAQAQTAAAAAKQQPARAMRSTVPQAATDSAAAAAAAAALAVSGSVKVPTKAPKTLYEFERTWRDLRSHPAAFAAYLRLLKGNNLVKIMEGAGSSSPDIVSSVMLLLQQQVVNQEHNTKEAMRILKGIGKAKGLSLSLMMMQEQETSALRDVLAQAEKEGFDTSAVRSAFRL